MQIKCSQNQQRKQATASSAERREKKKPNMVMMEFLYYQEFVYKSGNDEDYGKCFRINHGQNNTGRQWECIFNCIAWWPPYSVKTSQHKIFNGFFSPFHSHKRKGFLRFIFHFREFLLRIHHANEILFMNVSDLCFLSVRTFPENRRNSQNQGNDYKFILIDFFWRVCVSM